MEDQKRLDRIDELKEEVILLTAGLDPKKGSSSSS